MTLGEAGEARLAARGEILGVVSVMDKRTASQWLDCLVTAAFNEGFYAGMAMEDCPQQREYRKLKEHWRERIEEALIKASTTLGSEGNQ